MSKNTVTMHFNEDFFQSIMRSAGVEEMCRQKAQKVLDAAKATAPVGDPSNPVYRKPGRHPGQYKEGLHIEKVAHASRDTYMVVGSDPKTLLVESKTGNLARALKKAK